MIKAKTQTPKKYTEKTSIFTNKYFPYGLIAIILLIVYKKVFSLSFVNFDDKLFLVDNHIIICNFSNFGKIFTTGIWTFIHQSAPTDYYRPLLIASLMIESKFGGTAPFVFHLFNFLYHLISCFLLFYILEKLFANSKKSLILTLIFAVHPILTQAVAWIPGRNDSLLTISVLSSLILYFNYSREKKILQLILHFLFFFLSLLIKETGIIIPLICICWNKMFCNKKLIEKSQIKFYFIWLLIGFLYFFIRYKSIGNTETPVTLMLLTETVFYRLPALIQYFGKLILPFNLSVKPTQADTGYLLGFISTIIFCSLFFISKTKNSVVIIFGLIWFVAFLIPVLSLPKAFNDNLFEHRAYLPSVGFLIALGGFSFFDKLQNWKLIFPLIIIVVFSVITFLRLDSFSSPIKFWLNAGTNSPSDSESQFYLSKSYFDLGDFENAEKYILKSLALKPDIKRANAGLAVIYANKGQLEKAENYYKVELSLGTNYVSDFIGLGTVLVNNHKEEEALNYFNLGLKIDSNNVAIREQLATIYVEKKNYNEAEKSYFNIIRNQPQRLNMYKNIAILHYQQNDFQKAYEYGLEEEKLGGKMPDGFFVEVQRQLKINSKNN